jgi:hypothetical protein
MTKRQIVLGLKRIEKSKSNQDYIEALIKIYHLNISVVLFLSENLQLPKKKADRPKDVLKNLMSFVKANGNAKQIVTKKNLKIAKLWLDKMDVFFKDIKLGQPANTRQLINESEKIFSLLNISLTKLHIKNPA